MSTDVIVNVLRGTSNTLIASNILLQLDNMSVQEAAYYGGAAPYARYAAYTLNTSVTYLYGDLLQDQNNIDPRTNANAAYRVINHPESFPDGHVEIVADKVEGS